MSVKREGGAMDPLAKRSKSNTPAQDTEPAFDLGNSQMSRTSSISQQSGGSGNFSTVVPMAFDNTGDNSDGMSLPKKSMPTTDLKKSDSNSTANLLALPKKDEKKKSKAQSKSGQASSSQGAEISSGNKPPQTDPNKMQDVLFSAGVDIREEEALLNSSMNASKSQTQTANMKMPNRQAFLHPDQVGAFMKKVSKEQNFTELYKKF